jgi:GH24 family phage-related lysozyme (muramidase)/uncharacterized protein YgiM (DUF1202 family)
VIRRIISFLLIFILMCGLVTIAIPQSVQGAESSMTISQEALDYLKKEEGFCKTPYWDYKQYTIGYGTRCPDDKYEEWKETGITREEAEILLKVFLVDIENAVNKDLIDKYNLELTQGQFDALVCFSFNVGWSWIYKPSSNMHKAIVSGKTKSEVVRALSLYSKAGGEYLPALAKRRMRDANMYFNNDYRTNKPKDFGYVYYDANGGSLDYYIQGFDINEMPAPVKDPKLNGRTFLGWYTSKTDGTKIEQLTKDLIGLTLYAHWDGEDVIPPVETPVTTVEITVTGTNVNLREGPGTSYPIIGRATVGDKLTITETHQGSEYNWGKSDSGWICLKYTNYDLIKDQPDSPPEDSGTEDDTLPSDPLDPTTPTEPEAPTEPPHEHEYKETITKKPSCIAEGEKTYSCECGNSYTEKINVTAHTYESVVTQSTCTDAGFTTYTCKCGHSYTADETPALGHKYTDIITSPTCTKDGYTDHICEVCQHTYRDGVSKAPGHKYVKTVVNPTCTAGGYTNNVCSVCKDTIKTQSTKALGHEYKETIVKPTTSSQGYTEHACIRCSHKYKDTYTEKLNLKGRVKVNTYLCVRSAPGTSNPVVGVLYNCTEVEILEQKTVGKMVWGKIKSGWISMNYVEIIQDTPTTKPNDSSSQQKPAEPTKIEIGTVTANTRLRIRSGPGTSYSINGYLYNGDKVEILEKKTVKGTVWAKIANGWVSTEYLKISISTTSNSSNVNTVTVKKTITADCLRIRKGAGTNTATVGYLYKNDKVTILETKKVNGITWGRINKGWISMNYVK